MSRSWVTVVASVLFSGLVGCNSGQHSPAGFRLPPSGDTERGKTAFVAYDCHSCHAIAGVELPPAANQKAKLVTLGGEVLHQMTDGYLVTSIIHPSHVLAGVTRDQQASLAGKSQMPDYADRMTVRELTDIVEFLQTKYKVQPVSKQPALY